MKPTERADVAPSQHAANRQHSRRGRLLRRTRARCQQQTAASAAAAWPGLVLTALLLTLAPCCAASAWPAPTGGAAWPSTPDPQPAESGGTPELRHAHATALKAENGREAGSNLSATQQQHASQYAGRMASSRVLMAAPGPKDDAATLTSVVQTMLLQVRAAVCQARG